jgi:hypothetical protein
MSKVCMVKGCDTTAIDLGGSLLLCSQHISMAEELVSKLESVRGMKPASPKPVAKAKKPGRPPAKPKAKVPPAKVLKDDSEIEALLNRRIEKKGSAVVEALMKNYKVEKGSFASSTERIVAVMKALAERNPGLEVVGSGTKTVLRKKAAAPQQPTAPAPQA